MPHRKPAPKRETDPALKRSKTLIGQGKALLQRIRSSGLPRSYRNFVYSQLRLMFREPE